MFLHLSKAVIHLWNQQFWNWGVKNLKLRCKKRDAWKKYTFDKKVKYMHWSTTIMYLWQKLSLFCVFESEIHFFSYVFAWENWCSFSSLVNPIAFAISWTIVYWVIIAVITAKNWLCASAFSKHIKNSSKYSNESSN